MATGQIYMLLALLSFSLLGVLHKVADVKKSRPSAINALLASSSLLFVLLFVVFGTSTGPAVPARVAAHRASVRRRRRRSRFSRSRRA